MKLVIDRNVWLRGEGHGGGPSLLLRPRDGKRCCVGIYLSALGVPDEKLAGEEVANDLDAGTLPPQASWLAEEGVDGEVGPSGDAAILYQENDMLITTDFDGVRESEREHSIAARFARHGVVVEFVG